MSEFAEFWSFQGLMLVFQETVNNSLLRKFIGPVSDTPQGRVRYSKSLRFNATAGCDLDGLPIYTFNVGTAIGISDACMSLACDSNFCEDISFETSVVKEVAQVDPAQRFVDYGYLLREGRLTWPYTRLLDGPNIDESPRGQLGNHLNEFACKLISLHEQSHFLLGHVHLLKSWSHELTFDEVPSEKARLLGSHHLRSMELQADTLAYVLGVENYLTFGGHLTPRGLWLPAANKPEGYLFYALLGTALVFGILDRADRLYAQKLSERTHPSASTRLLNLFAIFQGSILHHIDSDQRRIELVSALLRECKVLFGVLQCEPLTAEAFNEYFDSSVDEKNYTSETAIELAATISDWDTLQSVLGSYAVSARSAIGMNF
jgi:hypothetical protein